MMIRAARTLSLTLGFTAFAVTRASGYAVGPAIPLDELAKTADLICKATVLSEQVATDPWFDKLMGFEVRDAELRVISVIKGTTKAKTLHFRHYTPAAGPVAGYEPQSYQLVVGRSYIVFASNADSPGVFRQIAKAHTMKEDQGLILTADAKPHRGKTITDAVWSELCGLIASKTNGDVIEGIRQLDEMSGGARIDLKDFDRKAALDAIRPSILSTTDSVATVAISVFGTDSPYFDDRLASFWLAGVGKGALLGISPLTPPAQPSADVATKELLAVATGQGSPELRALAIRVLGRSHAFSARQLVTWTTDREVAVRRAAILVSAELPDRTAIKTAVTDTSPEVRSAAALAIGFTQDPTLVPLLGTLLADKVPAVSAAAALALLSFASDQSAAVMTANLKTDWKPLFVNALALKDPTPYLGDLAEVIEKRLVPKGWWGGSTPAGVSWTLLYDYLKARTSNDLASGKLDRYLDALEHMQWFSSSEPRNLYALYLVRGMKARAKRFRETTRKAVSYDIDYYFDMADKNPATYVP